MTPAQFRLLCINANLIAELALQRFTFDDAIEPAEASSPATRPDDFDTLDLSALDGLDELIRQHTESSDPAGAGIELDPPQDAMDLDTQLSRAYADASISEERAATLQRQADGARIDALLVALPHPMPSLVSALTATQMTQVLDVYRQQHDAFDELIVMLRSLGAAGSW